MNLEKLNKQLTRNDIDFRISHLTGKDVVYAIILAYKDARVDMRILDEACGQLGWQVSYQRDSKGVLQATISIWDEEKKQWISKTSNGVESFTESQKGEYSDAFKRAGFMWGIGRGLYDFCFIMVTCDETEYYFDKATNKPKATNKLRPNDWIWEISEDYQDVKAYKKYGSEKKIKFSSKKNINPVNQTTKTDMPHEYEPKENKKELPWLNKFAKDGSELPFYWKIINNAKENSKTIKDLREHYKISKAVGEEVENDLKN